MHFEHQQQHRRRGAPHMDDAELRALLAAQARLISELSDRLAPARAAVPLGDLFARYEAAKKAKPSWYSWRAMLAPFVARLRERDAGTLAVLDWTGYREARADLAASSRNTTLAYVKAMFGWAVEAGLLAERPALCKAGNEDQKDHRETAPDESEIQRLLEVATKPREVVIVLCACDSGMRRNEIRQLQWTWIDWDRREIALPNWACKGQRGGVIPATRRQLAAIDAMPRDIRSPYVLRNAQGRPYAAQMLTNWWRALATAAGLQAVPGELRVRLHDGRHAYGTNAAKRGVHLETIQEVFRHASLDQTRAYVQTRPRDLDAAREAFEAGIAKEKSRR